MELAIFTDFDGTITAEDTLVHLLDHYIGSSWLEIERCVEAGTLSEEQGLRQEIALLSAPWKEARDLVLERVPIDPGFPGFAEFCAGRGWSLEILSGGLEPLIRAVLEREGLARLPLRANGLEFEADGRWRVRPAASPRINELCNHCKTHWIAAARAAGRRSAYIGDGCTDRCPGASADLLFAKGSLATWCDDQGIAHRPFTDFHDILAWWESDAGRTWLGEAGIR
jgi:2-hydroxy-3-keto-5-methylthiopentenyl-1-phosphate phosphatase